MDIKILDCTLRDGGYVNNWEFGRDRISAIINNLATAGIEYIECGFLKNENFDNDYSLFKTPNKISEFIDVTSYKSTQFLFMINYGDIESDNIDTCPSDNIILRIAFKKRSIEDIEDFSKKLQDKEYKIILNPMNAVTYKENELENLLNTVNKINPYGYTIVDTTGSLKTNELTALYKTTDENLNKNISIGLHSHNNLQLSFYNAQLLIGLSKKRSFIIDSTLMGMGRGAGNLATEVITNYINTIHPKYNTDIIKETAYNQIHPIYESTPWGNSIHYYLTALNNCHPNYAKYLIEKNITSIDKINSILSSIPEDKKSEFSIEGISI